VKESWVFLVLVAPLSGYDHETSVEEEFNFCYRDPKALPEGPYSWVASEAPIRDICDYIAQGLQEKGSVFLERILLDVLWGWERYMAQVRNDISGVYSSCAD
jgi:hypothetical protein